MWTRSPFAFILLCCLSVKYLIPYGSTSKDCTLGILLVSNPGLLVSTLVSLPVSHRYSYSKFNISHSKQWFILISYSLVSTLQLVGIYIFHHEYRLEQICQYPTSIHIVNVLRRQSPVCIHGLASAS